MKAKLWKLIHQWRDATTTESAWIARDQIDIELGRIESALAQQAEQVPEICEWKQDPDYELGDTYHSSCGELWSFVDGGPKENRVSYCHNCGKSVKLAAAKEST